MINPKAGSNEPQNGDVDGPIYNPLGQAFRNVGVVVLGLMLCFATVLLFEALALALNSAHAKPSQAPLPALLAVLAGYFAGPLAGTFLATKLASYRSWLNGASVAIIFMAGCILNFMELKHPEWFVFATFVALGLAAALGIAYGQNGKAPAPPRVSFLDNAAPKTKKK
jgi:hypothetical protein